MENFKEKLSEFINERELENSDDLVNQKEIFDLTNSLQELLRKKNTNIQDYYNELEAFFSSYGQQVSNSFKRIWKRLLERIDEGVDGLDDDWF